MRTVGACLALMALAACQEAARPAVPGCDGCTQSGGTCVDGACLCAGAGDPCEVEGGCCAAGEQCCPGEAGPRCASDAGGCPQACPDGEHECPAGTFCLTATDGVTCAGECADGSRCGENGCCGPGLGCLDRSCQLPDLQLKISDPVAVTFPAGRFAGDACEVTRACVAAAGPRTLLHVEFELENHGARLELGAPGSSPLFTPGCTGPVLGGFVKWRLLRGREQVVGEGRLDLSCIADGLAVSGAAPPNPRFDCGQQGLQPDWSWKIADADPCTGIDVTGVPAGRYLLELTANPDGLIPEASLTDDVASVEVVISAAGILERPANHTCLAPERPAATGPVALVEAFPDVPDLVEPTSLASAPGDRLLVTERAGRIVSIARGGTLQVAADLGDVLIGEDDGAGLWRIVLHPSFTTTGETFVAYTARAGPVWRSVVARLQSADVGATLDEATLETVLAIDAPTPRHGVTDLAFGPDGKLYVAVGDGSAHGDPRRAAQDLGSLSGKILRLDVDRARPYALPPDNPYVKGGGRGEVWASGLRFPWRIDFDPQDGLLWVADVGEHVQEIDVVTKGQKLGWPLQEGTRCLSPPCSGGQAPPVAEYGEDEGRSITGGVVYRGDDLGGPLQGRYLHADLASGKLWSLSLQGDGRQLLLETGSNPIAMSRTGDGEVLLLGNEGRIHRLVPAPAGGGELPRTLSESGCFDGEDPREVAPGMIPFAPRVEGFPEGAVARTHLALPDGSSIAVGPDGDFAFPPGAVLAQDLDAGGRRVETRMLFHHPEGGWSAASYRWNDEGTDAELLDGPAERDLGDGTTWKYPAPGTCLACHTAAAGRVLSAEATQLDGDLVYPGGRTANQLRTLATIGVVEPVPPGLAPLALPDGPATLESQARALLHAGCSSCHRPGSGTRGLDLRRGTPAYRIGACGSRAAGDDLGVPVPRVIAAGDPNRSVLLARVLAAGEDRMPPGSRVPDERTSRILAAWIAATDPLSCGACRTFNRGRHGYASCREAEAWLPARLLCSSFGSDLPVIDSNAEADFLTRESERRLGGDFWVGLFSDDGRAPRWIDGLGRAYSHWLPGQPADAGAGDDCAETDLATGRWRLVPCAATGVVLCETPCAPPTDEDRDQSLGCGADCNDDEPTVHPGAPETCGDGIDQDCDGVDAVCP